jgi:hypothetical protein
MSEFLISDKRSVRNIIQQVLKPYISLSDNEFVKVAQKAVSDLFDYAVQTNDEFKETIRKVLVENGGYASDIVKLVEEIKNSPKHPLKDNYVISIITPNLSPDVRETPNNIKIKGASTKIYDQNNIINGFREIREYANSIGKPSIYDKFKMLALFQSGLSVNRLSFTSLLPFEDFEKIYTKTLQRLEDLPNLQLFVDLDVFQRNNWANDDLVPNSKAEWITSKKSGKDHYNPSMKFLPENVQNAVKQGVIQPVMTRSIRSREARFDHIAYSWEDAKYSKEQKKKMREQGDFSYINKSLFKKVYRLDGQPLITFDQNGSEYYVYKAMNAWGARERAQEFYDVETPSQIDNGFLKLETVRDDEKIVGIFDQTEVVEKQPTVQSQSSSVKVSEPSKEGKMTLKNGKTYDYSKINSRMLEVIGYSPEEAGEILKKTAYKDC